MDTLPEFNYNEDEILDEIEQYIASTYNQHYAGEKDIQLFDYWQSIGILTPVAIGTAMKYLARFGKKEGANRKDLLKAAHYVILALYDQSTNEQFNNDIDPRDDDEGMILAQQVDDSSADSFQAVPFDAFTKNVRDIFGEGNDPQ